MLLPLIQASMPRASSSMKTASLPSYRSPSYGSRLLTQNDQGQQQHSPKYTAGLKRISQPRSSCCHWEWRYRLTPATLNRSSGLPSWMNPVYSPPSNIGDINRATFHVISKAASVSLPCSRETRLVKTDL
jgi:hypothetical protein